MLYHSHLVVVLQWRNDSAYSEDLLGWWHMCRKQISKMGKNKKVKKVIGSAKDSAVRGEGADGATADVAAAGMEPGLLPAGAAGG